MTDTVGSGAPLLSLQNIVKSFEGTQALRGVSLDIRAGEFVGLVGPNGAGKSTLIKILDGVYAPDSGTIRVDGVPQSVSGGHLPGVGVVHQDLALVGTLTVTENLRLGMPALHSVGPFLSPSKEHDFCSAALTAVGLSPDLANKSLERLSLGERTLVAIARTFAQGAALVVVDEATSALSPRESLWLIDTLKARKRGGAAVLMVSHKLSEILDATDRCVVLVDGRVQGDVTTAHTDLGTLTRLMSPVRDGQVQVAQQRERTSERPHTEPVLVMDGACVKEAGPFTLDVRRGEIVGVTGLVGSGLYELAMLASGRTRPTSGSVLLDDAGDVGLLPPDRGTQGNFPAETVAWNLTIGSLRRWRRRSGLLDLEGEVVDAQRRIEDLEVRPARGRARQASLSGGNQQKVLLGRVLLQTASFMVLCEPTRGVDVRARAEIYRLVNELPAQGIAVLVVSSDTEDLLALADRVGVVEQGRCSETWPVDELDATQMASLL